MKKLTSVLLASALFLGVRVSAGGNVSASSAETGEQSVVVYEERSVTVTPADDGKTFSVDNAKVLDFYENYYAGYSSEFYGSGEYRTLPIVFEWQGEGIYYQVYVSDEKHFINAEKYLTATSSLTLRNIVPNRKYYWKVKTTDADGAQSFSPVYTFTPTAYVRTMEIDGVENMRDLGGLKTSDGRTIQYGIIYRSADLDSVTEEGKSQIKKLGIKTDIDLRGASVAASPLGEDVKRLNFNAPYYVNEKDNNKVQAGLDGDESYKKEFANEIKACADKNNYPLNFHCSYGRDRTGTLAAMLYAISGVSRYDIVREYELSWFSKSAANSTVIKISAINKLCDYIEGLNGADFKEKASGYLLSIGVTQAEIDSVRNILTGVTKIADDTSAGNPSEPEEPTEPAQPDEPEDWRVFADGNFGYTGKKTAMNVYEGSTVVSYTAAEAAEAGVPTGYDENVLKISPAENASKQYQFDALIDFSARKIKRSRIEGITIRLYVVSTDKDNAKHPEVRIPTANTGDWILRSNVSDKTDRWITITLTEKEIDGICSYGGGYLTKFDLGLRSEKATVMYIDDITVTLTSVTDGEPPVITVPSKTITTTDGTYVGDICTVADNSGNAEVSLKWSEGALDRRGRLLEGDHSCTITATDASDNTATETITFSVEKEPEIKLYKITFKSAEAEDITVVYTDGESKADVTPEVPSKKYYTGMWEDFSLEKAENQTVNAKYVPITYTVYFKADEKTVAQTTYTVENTEITVPAVPEKKGYTGKWSDYTLNGGDKIVKAVYEKTETSDSDTEQKPDPKPDPKPEQPGSSSETGGCKGDLGAAVGLPFIGAVAVALKKKKE